MNVDYLNKVQAQWMALQSDDPEEVKRKVFSAMNSLPHNYLSVSKDGTRANVNCHGLPFFSEAQPMEIALAWAKARGIQTEVGWQGNRWIALGNGGAS